MSSEVDVPEPRPISVWRRLLLLTGVLVAVLVAAGVANWSYQGRRAQERLQALLIELDAKERPWTLEQLVEARPQVPPANDSARIIGQLRALLPRDWPTPAFDRQFQESPPPPELLDPGRRQLLADEMRRVVPALEKARALEGMPDGRHKLVIPANPIGMLLEDQQETRRAANLLRYDAWDRALDGDLKGALRAARAGVCAARSLDEEPFVISQLIRTACVAVALAGVERSLGLGEASDADLAALQRLLELEEKHPTLLVAVRGERALLHALFDRMESGEIPLKEPGDPWISPDRSLSLPERIFGISRTTLRRQHALGLEMMAGFVAAAKLPPQEQAAAEQRVAAEVERAVREGRAQLAALLLPAMSRVSNAFRRKLAQVRCMQALLAVEQYRLRTGRWPDRLDDLAPALLPAVPLDPHDGKPLRYRRTADGVVVYSVGEDRADNGGKLHREGVVGPGTDLGYQLWDVKKRRQPAKPPPKLPDEDDGAP